MKTQNIPWKQIIEFHREIADTPFETIERIRESLQKDVF